jgi:purine-binding chemotaxis protein CheW
MQSELIKGQASDAAGITRSILRKRAAVLAQERATVQQSSEFVNVIAFLLSGESYAFETSRIKEVYPLKEVTPLPCTPESIVGIINVRGHIITVLDLKKLLGLHDSSIRVFDKAIIVEREDVVLGFLADEVLGAKTIIINSLVKELPTLSGLNAEYLYGVTPDRLILLNLDRILSDPRIVVNEEVG